MTSAAIATMLCYIMAMGMALPSKVAVSEDLKAETQWHLRAPALGCVEIFHYAGGSYFRSYACDHPNGACIYSPAVPTCPEAALYAKPNLERIVNIRSRDHVFRYYNHIGGACRLSILPECCSVKASTAEYDDTKSQDELCKCIDLPTGERICDPIDCESGLKQTEKVQGNEAVVEALLKYIMKKN